MRAPWACSREQRIALYNRSSINQNSWETESWTSNHHNQVVPAMETIAPRAMPMGAKQWSTPHPTCPWHWHKKAKQHQGTPTLLSLTVDFRPLVGGGLASSTLCVVLLLPRHGRVPPDSEASSPPQEASFRCSWGIRILCHCTRHAPPICVTFQRPAQLIKLKGVQGAM